MTIRNVPFARYNSLILRGETLQDFVDRWQLEAHHEEVSPDIDIVILLYLVEILQPWETLQTDGN